MIKANAENYWMGLDAQNENRATLMQFAKWFRKPVSALQHFISVSSKLTVNVFSLFFIRGQRKDQLQQFKDEFYLRRSTGLKNIPSRTWKRHSALLVYQQRSKAAYREQMHNQHIKQARESVQKDALSVEPQAFVKSRMSFRVKSIRILPIWSSALSEMSAIEGDLSSLRFMESRPLVNKINKAA